MSIEARLNKLEHQTGDQSLVVIVGKMVDGVFIPNDDTPPIPAGQDVIVVRIVDYSE